MFTKNSIVQDEHAIFFFFFFFYSTAGEIKHLAEDATWFDKLDGTRLWTITGDDFFTNQ